MKNFSFKIPQNIEFSIGCLNKLPHILQSDSINHVFIISDHGLEGIGLVKKVENIISDHGIKVDKFLDVSANPTIQTVNKANEDFKKSGAQGIIALGGGSPIDVAKSVGVLSIYGGNIKDYEGNHKVPGAITPIIAIPTTAGTGSEVTASSVITDQDRNYKMTIFSYELLPKYALLDPELITSTPFHIAAACGIDALIHAIESYLSLNASPFSEAMSEKAMELIGRSIRNFVANPNNLDAASDMMAGSNFAGIAFAWARLGCIHAMSHPISAHFNVPHGVANAVLMPTVMNYNSLADTGKYKKIYYYIKNSNEQYKNPESLISELKALNHALKIPSHLSDLGLTLYNSFIELMAIDASKSANTLANPRYTSIADLIDLYNLAYK